METRFSIVIGNGEIAFSSTTSEFVKLWIEGISPTASEFVKVWMGEFSSSTTSEFVKVWMG